MTKISTNCITGKCCASQKGRPEMGLDRYIEARIDLAILTDQCNPRKNTSDGRRSPRNAHRLEIQPDYGDDQSSDDDDDPVEDTSHVIPDPQGGVETHIGMYLSRKMGQTQCRDSECTPCYDS